MKKYATYLRVSTSKQGASGLGLSSQQKICADFINANGGEHVAEFKDIESGTHRDRKGLVNAVAYCKKNNCALVIAKLDRLARDVEFCFKIVNTGIEMHFCDMPQVNTLLLGVFASVAQYERELTSDRTKKALAVKKSQGAKLGASSEVYKKNFEAKTKEQKKEESAKRGYSRSTRHAASRDFQVFLKVLKNVFPNACADDNAANWDWACINTKGDAKARMVAFIKDYKELDGDLFCKWTIDEWDAAKIQVRLANEIKNVRNTVMACARYAA